MVFNDCPIFFTLSLLFINIIKIDEIIEIKHEALSRKMFSDGAVRAVEFLFGKKAGLYTMKDVLGL